MILADTSVWIDHLRAGDKQLGSLLSKGEILVHPFVTSELALGSLRNRDKTLQLLDLLPQAVVAHTDEVRHLIETRRLFALGLGLVDAHLIASTLITQGVVLWTRDKPLRKAAESLGVQAALP